MSLVSEGNENRFLSTCSASVTVKSEDLLNNIKNLLSTSQRPTGQSVKKMIPVYFKNQIEHTITLCGQNAGYVRFNIKAGGIYRISMFQRANCNNQVI